MVDDAGKCFLPLGEEMVLRALELNKSHGKTTRK